MKRRQLIKALTLTGAGAAVLPACNTADKKAEDAAAAAANDPVGALTIDRAAEEKERERKLFAETFFNPHEMATIAVLSDIIIPRDEVSGSATEAGVPAFIEFIVKDKPDFKTPMRGGLKWLDVFSGKHYGKAFKDLSGQQQISIVDQIAYPEKAAPDVQQGVNFFSLVRNLTATGFFSSKMGIADVGYVGNAPNQWNGVPDDVLKQYGLAYTQKELDECVKFS